MRKGLTTFEAFLVIATALFVSVLVFIAKIAVIALVAGGVLKLTGVI
jgi:hypothetical protein